MKTIPVFLLYFGHVSMLLESGTDDGDVAFWGRKLDVAGIGAGR